MDNCKHLEPKTITEEIVSFCAWCGNPICRDFEFIDTQNPNNNSHDFIVKNDICSCWAYGKNYPIWLKKFYRIWLKLNNKYNNKKFMEQ